MWGWLVSTLITGFTRPTLWVGYRPMWPVGAFDVCMYWHVDVCYSLEWGCCVLVAAAWAFGHSPLHVVLLSSQKSFAALVVSLAALSAMLLV